MKDKNELLIEASALLRSAMDSLETVHEFDEESMHGMALILMSCYSKLRVVIGSATAEGIHLA